MNCNEARQSLDAHLDHELDSVRDAEVAAHLRSCPVCTQLAQNRAAWIATVVERLPRHAPPAFLANRIRDGLRAAAAESVTAPVIPAGPARRRFDFSVWSSLLAVACSALALGFFWGQSHGQSRPLDALLSSHVAALTSGHLTEVVSSDRHTVKPWLAQHVDFSPPVTDLAGEGFPLAGARVERLDGQQVAALVYHRGQHVITVFVWPAEAARLAAAKSARGYHATAWRQDDFNYAVVSDLAPEELERFGTLLRRP